MILSLLCAIYSRLATLGLANLCEHHDHNITCKIVTLLENT